MARYSASRISAVVLSLGWILIAAVGVPQTAHQDYGVGWTVWLLLGFATLGPLVLTNVLWFRSLHRIGASRATLVANLQPFVAAVFALVLLSEGMTLLQVLGGILIAGGILTARRRAPRPRPNDPGYGSAPPGTPCLEWEPARTEGRSTWTRGSGSCSASSSSSRSRSRRRQRGASADGAAS